MSEGSEGVQLTDEQRIDWLRLIRSPNVGPRGLWAHLHGVCAIEICFKKKSTMARGRRVERIILCRRQFALRGCLFGGSATPNLGCNDLTGGVALPMFPAAGRR